MEMDTIFKKIRKQLEKFSLMRLQEILLKCDKWFIIEDYDKDTIEKRNKVETRKEIINWILSQDPILVSGGLLDFLYCKINGSGLKKLTEDNK